MKNRNQSRTKIENLFKEKELFHKELAKLSFEEKIKILVRLQKIAQAIQPSSKKKQMVWKIE
ncbi:MAG: hypothetical protein GQ476_03835 [Candidatus Aminicenantes bacterium]|jgi:hypothetical protein|nr:hypothetical protein [Candidatus Aminicenantes bacterium]